ncbi:MAG: hypothetical protein RLY43_1362 [Bacteroidota bacterium]
MITDDLTVETSLSEVDNSNVEPITNDDNSTPEPSNEVDNSETIEPTKDNTNVETKTEDTRPEFLHEKFKTVEEQAKAYSELEKIQTRHAQKASELEKELQAERQKQEQLFKQFGVNDELDLHYVNTMKQINSAKEHVSSLYEAGQISEADKDQALIELGVNVAQLQQQHQYQKSVQQAESNKKVIANNERIFEQYKIDNVNDFKDPLFNKTFDLVSADYKDSPVDQTFFETLTAAKTLFSEIKTASYSAGYEAAKAELSNSNAQSKLKSTVNIDSSGNKAGQSINKLPSTEDLNKMSPQQRQEVYKQLGID